MNVRLSCGTLLLVAILIGMIPPSVAVAASATPTPTPTVAAAKIDAVVASKTLNLRAGPGTAFSRIATLNRGTKLAVSGQVNKCAWLKVKTPKGQEGWVARTSGSTVLVTLNAKCETVPAAKAPPVPTKVAKPPAAAPKAAPKATPTSPPKAAAPEIDPNLACYLIENFLGAELTVTINARDWAWSDTFKIAPMGTRFYCLGPGRYTYTIDAPPPWADINGELDAQKGDRYRWPIAGQ